MNDLAGTFREKYHTSPTLLARAPGRVNLIGEHIDYNGGFVLPAAIKQDVRIVARPSTGNSPIRIHSTNFLEHWEHNPADILEPPSVKRWWSYFLAVIDQFRLRGLDIPPFDAVVEGSVPLGSGLSSSAALEVAAATLLNELSGNTLNRLDIARIAQAAEHGPFIGVQCGIMDQFASVFGEQDHALMIDCHSHENTTVPFDSTGATIVIINSMKQRGLVDSEYNRRREECLEGLAFLSTRSGFPFKSLRHVPMEIYTNYTDHLPSNIRRRVRHVITENARVESFAEAIRESNWQRAGKMLLESHRSLRDDFQVSCEELDTIVEVTRALPSVWGCRMTGAGFGGCAIALVQPDHVDGVVEKIKENYLNRYSITPEIYITTPGPGATLNHLP